MTFARVRLAVAVSLFTAWIGCLVYLSATTVQPVILSRPQFLVSNFDVVAQLERTDGSPPQVEVVEVRWPTDDRTRQALVGKTIPVVNLEDCRGWTGPGRYLLPLMTSGKEYRVAPIPRSPGYPQPGRPVIYPWTPQVEAQLGQIPKPTDRLPIP
jgi:hypothetical protein